MTAPDPRPYAAPGDLVTAADVAEWLREHAAEWRADARAHPEVGARMVRLDYGGAVTLDGALSDLTARLDRERRQACRRGSLAEFHAACRERVRERWRFTSPTDAANARKRRARSLTRALAFRAAARAQ